MLLSNIPIRKEETASTTTMLRKEANKTCISSTHGGSFEIIVPLGCSSMAGTHPLVSRKDATSGALYQLHRKECFFSGMFLCIWNYNNGGLIVASILVETNVLMAGWVTNLWDWVGFELARRVWWWCQNHFPEENNSKFTSFANKAMEDTVALVWIYMVGIKNAQIIPRKLLALTQALSSTWHRL